MLTILSDEYFMKEALKEAEKALEEGEVPIGAVVVANQQIIARAHNQTERLMDVTAHAEVIAITAAANYLGSKYLKDCTLYVTMEPCLMCAGALAWSQIDQVIYGAADEKRGFMRIGKLCLHPKTKLAYGILENDCSNLVKSFFQEKRKLTKY